LNIPQKLIKSTSLRTPERESYATRERIPFFEFIRLRDFKGVEGGFWPYQE
jgi:hypothetical protein